MACAPRKDSDQPEHLSFDQSLPCPWRKLGSLATHWACSENSGQTGQLARLIGVFTGCTCHFVGFVMRRLIFLIFTKKKRLWHFLYIVSSKPIFWNKIRKKNISKCCLLKQTPSMLSVNLQRCCSQVAPAGTPIIIVVLIGWCSPVRLCFTF